MATLKWRDAEDVYKPIKRSLKEFLQSKDRQIIEQSCRNLDDIYTKIKPNQMTVFVEKEAVDRLIAHLSVDPYNETGGVLVGDGYFCPQKRKNYTEIVGSIPASYTIGNRVHFQFTAECWQEILKTQKQSFPKTTIVGWYHSHPGHGIFLSGTDLNTQRLCFNKIWQIAIVYDPLHKDIGFFYGARGQRLDPIYLVQQPLPAQPQIDIESSQNFITEPRNENPIETSIPSTVEDGTQINTTVEQSTSLERRQFTGEAIALEDKGDLFSFLIQLFKFFWLLILKPIFNLLKFALLTIWELMKHLWNTRHRIQKINRSR
jgi:proteasome lid subunit RPN8/RPN11